MIWTVYLSGEIHTGWRDQVQAGAEAAGLTREHEAQAEPERPWKMTDSSADYISQMLAAIVGIEIVVERLLGKFKLSLNKTAIDVAFTGVRVCLGTKALSRWGQKARPGPSFGPDFQKINLSLLMKRVLILEKLSRMLALAPNVVGGIRAKVKSS